LRRLGRATPADCLLIAGLLLLVAGLFYRVGTAAPGSRVIAVRDGNILFSAPLSETHETALEGPLGPTLLRVEGGEARILDSPCPHRICVRMGAIRNAGDLLACVPNRLVVQIEGQPPETPQAYDLLSR